MHTSHNPFTRLICNLKEEINITFPWKSCTLCRYVAICSQHTTNILMMLALHCTYTLHSCKYIHTRYELWDCCCIIVTLSTYTTQYWIQWKCACTIAIAICVHKWPWVYCKCYVAIYTFDIEMYLLWFFINFMWSVKLLLTT